VRWAIARVVLPGLVASRVCRSVCRGGAPDECEPTPAHGGRRRSSPGAPR
jgi:hypothetical protein